MMQLSLLAPGLVGLVVAAASVLYAHRIASGPRKKPAAATPSEDKQLPFEFSPPTVLTPAEGTIQATIRRPERVH